MKTEDLKRLEEKGKAKAAAGNGYLLGLVGAALAGDCAALAECAAILAEDNDGEGWGV